jgi:type I restriction-modification system DNA methylase subunit
MIDEIYERFLEIEDSSREIEKIINIYLKFAYKKSESKEEIIYNNLAVNTFNYMIETDETLKVAFSISRICCESATKKYPPKNKSSAKNSNS